MQTSPKIALTLLAAVLYHRSQSPPVKSEVSVTAEEQKKASGAAPIPLGERLIPYAAPAGNAIYWLMALTEIAATLATRHPERPLSQHILAVLKSPVAKSSLLGRLTASSLSGSIFVIAGSLIRLRCYREMGRQFTFRLTVRDDHKLITTGPYSVVRHPSYTGGIMSVIGFAILFVGRGSWWREGGYRGPYGKFCSILVAAAIGWKLKVFTRAGREDYFLRKQFKAEWEDWARKVPSRYLPGIY